MNYTLKPYVKVKVFEDPQAERGFEGLVFWFTLVMSARRKLKLIRG